MQVPARPVRKTRDLIVLDDFNTQASLAEAHGIMGEQRGSKQGLLGSDS